MNYILPRTARKTDFGTIVPAFLLMDGSANELLCFLVWPLHKQQWVLVCSCLVGASPYSHYVMRSFPLEALGRRVFMPDVGRIPERAF